MQFRISLPPRVSFLLAFSSGFSIVRILGGPHCPAWPFFRLLHLKPISTLEYPLNFSIQVFVSSRTKRTTDHIPWGTSLSLSHSLTLSLEHPNRIKGGSVYRVTHHVVPKVLLTSTQKLRFSIRSIPVF